MKTFIAIATGIAIDTFGSPTTVALAVAAGVSIWIGMEFIKGLCMPNR